MSVIEFRLPDINPSPADAPFYVLHVLLLPADATNIVGPVAHPIAADHDAIPYDPEFVAEVRARRREDQ